MPEFEAEVKIKQPQNRKEVMPMLKSQRSVIARSASDEAISRGARKEPWSGAEVPLLYRRINPKHEIRNPKQCQSTNNQNSKQNEFWYLNLFRA